MQTDDGINDDDNADDATDIGNDDHIQKKPKKKKKKVLRLRVPWLPQALHGEALAEEALQRVPVFGSNGCVWLHRTCKPCSSCLARVKSCHHDYEQQTIEALLQVFQSSQQNDEDKVKWIEK